VAKRPSGRAKSTAAPARVTIRPPALGAAGYLSYPHRRQAPISPRTYKGFTITPRTFQVRGSGRWTIDILIGRRGSLRAFSQPDTLITESAAVEECWMLARRIIDQSTPHCSVYDLSGV